MLPRDLRLDVEPLLLFLLIMVLNPSLLIPLVEHKLSLAKMGTCTRALTPAGPAKGWQKNRLRWLSSKGVHDQAEPQNVATLPTARYRCDPEARGESGYAVKIPD